MWRQDNTCTLNVLLTEASHLCCAWNRAQDVVGGLTSMLLHAPCSGNRLVLLPAAGCHRQHSSWGPELSSRQSGDGAAEGSTATAARLLAGCAPHGERLHSRLILQQFHQARSGPGPATSGTTVTLAHICINSRCASWLCSMKRLARLQLHYSAV